MADRARRVLAAACLVAALAAGQAAVAMAQGLEEFQAMSDNRLAVRTSFGVRSARPLAADQVELVIGMSATDACQNPAAYRVASFDDDAYAYEKFVAPTEAKSGRELEVQGPNQRGEGYGVSETAFPRLRESFASLYTFVDSHFAISMDEGTVVTQARSMAAFGLLLPDRK
jgi:hypothetical protein